MHAERTRYKLTIGHPIEGAEREYKTVSEARRAAAKAVEKGEKVTLWEGVLRAWGGWSWSSIPAEED